MSGRTAATTRTYGRDHAQVAITLFNLAMVSGALGDIPKAGELLKRALTIYESTYGPNHPDTKQCQDGLAVVASLTQ